MKSNLEKFEEFRRIMDMNGYEVVGVFDNFIAVLDAVPGRDDMPKRTLRGGADGLFFQVGDGPFVFAHRTTGQRYVDHVVEFGRNYLSGFSLKKGELS